MHVKKPVKAAKKELTQSNDKNEQNGENKECNNENKSTKSKRTVTSIQSTLYNPIRNNFPNKEFLEQFCSTFAHGNEGYNTQFQYLLPSNIESIEFIESKFGQVPRGSIISYHFPPENLNKFIQIPDAPSFPNFPFKEVKGTYLTALNRDEADIFYGYHVTIEQALKIEHNTTDQSANPEWYELRSKRLTSSNFKRICSRKDNFDSLATDLITKKNIQTAAMKHGLAYEDTAANAYLSDRSVNLYRSGFFINPHISYLGTSPDFKVYDPDATEKFGLLEIKCPSKESITEVPYIKEKDGEKFLNRNHDYFYQVMGQLGLTGASWCDFMVWCPEDHFVERIYFDEQKFISIQNKLDKFFFEYYLPNLIKILSP